MRFKETRSDPLDRIPKPQVAGSIPAGGASNHQSGGHETSELDTTDGDIERSTAEAEAGHEVAALSPRGGRPPIGSGPAGWSRRLSTLDCAPLWRRSASGSASHAASHAAASRFLSSVAVADRTEGRTPCP